MRKGPARKPRNTGTYACGTETHERIINAAIELFGERGFDAASTREIARRAGILAPLLNYYFTNKEGLYQACAASIYDSTRQFFDHSMNQIRQALDEQASHEVLQSLLENQLCLTLEFLMTNQHAQRRRLFIMQDTAGNGPGGHPDETLVHHRKQQMLLLNRLVAALCGMDPEDPVVRIRTLSLQGQVGVFYTFRQPTMNMLGWEQVDAERLAIISRALIDNMRILLQGWRVPANPTEPSNTTLA